MRFKPHILELMQVRADAAEQMIHETGIIRFYNQGILDSSDALQTARELVQIKKILYYEQFPEFKADQLCPVSTAAHTGSKQVGYDILSPTGMAQVVDDDAEDPPVAEIKKTQTVQPVVTIKNSIKWNIQDLREANLSQMSGLSANYSFTEEKTRAVLLGLKRKEEDIFIQGDAKVNVPGFLNNSNMPQITLPTVGSTNYATLKFSEATPEQLVQFLNFLRNGINDQSEGVFSADTLLMSQAPYDVLATKPFTGNNGTATETVLSFYLKTQRRLNPNFDILPYPYLKILEPSTKYRFVAYFKDPMVLNQEIPQPMETFGPYTINNGQTFTTVVRERHAGVQLRYPVATGFISVTK